MSKSPVQVILNSDEFILHNDPTPKPVKPKDFFEDDNEGFITLKKQVINSLSSIEKLQSGTNRKRTLYAKVTVRKKALAKSYRPTQKLFTEKNYCKVVGGLHMGEMFIKLAPGAAKAVKDNIIAHAEEKVVTDINKQTHKDEPKPSRWRCELSSIDQISEYTVQDKLALPAQKMAEKIITDNVGLYIELFEKPVNRQEYDSLTPSDASMILNFVNILQQINGIRAFKSKLKGNPNLLVIHITSSKDTVINLTASSNVHIQDIESNINRIQDAILKIATCDIVKKITPIPSIEKFFAPSFNVNGTVKADIPFPEAGKEYPKIGVIDTGVSDIFENWILDKEDSIPKQMQDNSHATFIAGLLVIGHSLNCRSDKNEFCKELDGCKIYDLAILPKEKNIADIYPEIEDFYDALVGAVANAAEQGVRIFNLSLNEERLRSYSEYSPFATALDKISEEYDVIFIISAGNLKIGRSEWTKQWDINTDNIKKMNGVDIAFSPSESLRNISVGALNATDLGLASYSRIGKGSSLAIKPDLVYVGGDSIDMRKDFGHGLYSLDVSGNIISECGTSFAAPQVAKIIASLENDIEGHVSRETLMALTIHSGIIPKPFQDKHYGLHLKDIIGYGMPQSSLDILNGDEHAITMVFAGRIKNKFHLSFEFTWPKGLVENGKLRGAVKLTLVSTPRLYPDYGEEQIRDTLIAYLRQHDDKSKKRGLLHPLYKSHIDKKYLNEWKLIEENQKWSPVKVSERVFTSISGTSNFSFDIEHLTRETSMALKGIPFTAILTISDPKKEAPVYEQMRTALRFSKAKIADIQIAARNTLRV